MKAGNRRHSPFPLLALPALLVCLVLSQQGSCSPADYIAVAQGDVIRTNFTINQNQPGEYDWTLVSERHQVYIFVGETIPSSVTEKYSQLSIQTIISPVRNALIGHRTGDRILLEIPFSESPYQDEPTSPLYGKNLQYDLTIEEITYDAKIEPVSESLLRPEFILFVIVVPVAIVGFLLVVIAYYAHRKGLESKVLERFRPRCEICRTNTAIGTCANEKCGVRLCQTCFGAKGCPVCGSNRIHKA